ncbi:MAG: cytochrome C oxidase subunit IV family protein, partial [Deltaproteobacteria bacterium]|nr:cytochrome C oxidase subunit IV family protein [Deltaproteobacteria bacterium]
MSHIHRVQAPEPHVLPVRVYWIVFGALLALTALTVWVAEFDFGTMSTAVALSVATMKATLVLAVFMHLWFDNRFFTLVFAVTLVFLSLFVLFCVMDEGTRGMVDPARANFVPRDERVLQYETDHPGALPLRPGLIDPIKDDLIF